MEKSTSFKKVCIVFAFCIATTVTSPAQTFTTLVSFDGTNGDYPAYMSLIQGFDGNLYGTTYRGGANGLGEVFKITEAEHLTTLHSFDSTEGANPYGLLQATSGIFYGTTSGGGTDGYGTIFEITTEGTLTTLHSFDGIDGYAPAAGLVQAANGNFYGTTYFGGTNNDGTIFEITASGSLTTLYNFCSQTACDDGEYPEGVLVQATNGNFYGTTNGGGANGEGTVFEITAGGRLTTLHSFNGTDGDTPLGVLVVVP